MTTEACPKFFTTISSHESSENRLVFEKHSVTKLNSSNSPLYVQHKNPKIFFLLLQYFFFNHPPTLRRVQIYYVQRMFTITFHWLIFYINQRQAHLPWAENNLFLEAHWLIGVLHYCLRPETCRALNEGFIKSPSKESLLQSVHAMS